MHEGFRKGRRTQDIIVDLRWVIEKVKEHNMEGREAGLKENDQGMVEETSITFDMWLN